LGFADGTEVPADVIVWATGFERNMKDAIKQTLGEEVASHVDNFFSPNKEGEIGGFFRPQRKCLSIATLQGKC
jgi:uncharacterized NAD(P)/FAD-binding protein YdhS